MAEDIYGNCLIATEIGFTAWDEKHWTETLRTNKGEIVSGAGLLSKLGRGTDCKWPPVGTVVFIVLGSTVGELNSIEESVSRAGIFDREVKRRE